MSLCHVFYGLVFFAGMLAACQPAERETDPVQAVQTYLQLKTDTLDQEFQLLLQRVEAHAPERDLQQSFERARDRYKNIEPLIELYFPVFADAVNGPAIDEQEPHEGGKVTYATGFQVIEEYMYPVVDTSAQTELVAETRFLAGMIGRLRQLISNNQMTDEHIFQAMRLEVLRIMALGVSGFDSPIAFRSLPEAVAALRGIDDIVSIFERRAPATAVKVNLAKAYAFLQQGVSFNDFDRATFFADIMTPLSKSLYAYQQTLGIANRPLVSAVDMSKDNFFEKGIFMTDYFSNPDNRTPQPEAAQLGKMLFFDPILSGNNKRSCASCHQPDRAFTDGRAKSLAFEGKGEVSRNAPTLINALYQRMLFYDSRTMFLEDQAADVMANVTEMHGHIDEAVTKISRSPEYQELFKKAYNKTVTRRTVQLALAAYIRSLSSMNSGFDRYMRGEKTAMTPEAVAGFNVFMGKAKCATCHFMPLFNGTVPALYMKSESEVLGIPAKPDTAHATADADLGKFNTYHDELNKHAFKTPTVRNAGLTGPYMHNGVYTSLEQVVDFYNRGGGAGIGIVLPNQTLPPDKLELTTQEQKNIIAFIHSLTDTAGLTTPPRYLPAFPDAALNARKVGGEY
ncbi:cytochrome-c peroxidase [Dawidia soli]|uniref:Cytochrome C peroxidase n=1 Tax=Dawidia soli TaxID=2782352 RepID=A0AAP2DCC0_9BACT|nr:cytochrome c peroxidase [Dawidia soli]MBT1688095.1 cytochrome C peroxidase [Dawidia soli]